MRNDESTSALSAAINDVFDCLDTPMFMVDLAGRIQFSNQAADRLIAAGKILGNHAGRLTISRPKVSQRFADLCAEMVASARARAAPLSRTLRLGARDDADLGLLVHVRPQWIGSTDAEPLLLVVAAKLHERADYLDMLRDLNGLTATESAVVQRLLHGERVSGIARTLRMAPGTARSHMKRAFKKCGVHSQSQLVQLVARQIFTLAPFRAGG